MVEFGRVSRRIVDEDRNAKAFWAHQRLCQNGVGDSQVQGFVKFIGNGEQSTDLETGGAGPKPLVALDGG